MLNRYEKQLEDAKNGKFQPFAFAFQERNEETEKLEIQYIQEQVDQWKETLRHFTEDCIID